MRFRRRISTGSMPIFAAARSTRPSVTEHAIGWPTARYWHITFLFWNTTRARPGVRAGVRPAHEIHDLVCFDAAGARVDRIGPDAGEVVDFPGRDGAVALYANAGVHPMVARMNVGDEVFQPISNEF